jgi:hypothetical protein
MRPFHFIRLAGSLKAIDVECVRRALFFIITVEMKRLWVT